MPTVFPPPQNGSHHPDREPEGWLIWLIVIMFLIFIGLVWWMFS